MKDTIPYSTVANNNKTLQGFRIDSVRGSFEGDMIDVNAADSLSASIVDNRHTGVNVPFTMEQADSVFGLLLICFLFFAHIYNGGVDFLKENISLLLSSEKSHRSYKQTTSREILYSYFLIFQAVVLISICMYDVFMEYEPMPDGYIHRPLVTIFLFILVIGLFLGLKSIMYSLLAYIFDEDAIVSVWRRTHVISLEVLGILYFVPTLFLVYAGYYQIQIIIFMLVLFLIVQLLLFYQIIIFFIREKFNFLYWIAYLCTFEIIPYIFLYLGLRYLYRFDVFNILWL